MSKESKILRAFASSREIKKEEATPALVPKLRFPEFRGAEGWKGKPVGRFLTESRLAGSKGNTARKITVKLWGNGVFEKNEAVQGSINTQYFRRKAGQFIYSKLDFLNQAFGIIPGELDGFESTVDLPCFDIADDMNPGFLLEYVKRKEFYEKVGEIADGSRKAKRIHAETFLACSIALPPPAEQQKIAECLSSVDELMAAQARKVDALKTHKNGLMQQLFPREGETQPRLRFTEFQNAGEWEESKLISLSSEPLSNGVFNDPKKVGTGYKLINVSDMYIETTIDERRLSLLELSPSEFEGNQVITGDIFFTRSSLVKSGIAVSNIYLGSSSDVTYDGHLIRFRPNTSKVVPLFAHHLFKTAPIRAQLIARGKTATMTTIGQADVASVTLFCPDKAEQQRIASCLSSIDALITAETQKLEALKTHKKGLMQQLFPSPEKVEA